MEKVLKFFDDIWHVQVLNSLIIILLSMILYKSITYMITKGEKNSSLKLFSSKRSATYLRLIKSINRHIFIIVTILIILQVNGINVSSVLAGVGIVGVIFGLAMQDWLKDIIRGSGILLDNYFSVGDVVKYKEIEGKVIVIGLKTTKIQDLKNNNVIAIANRNIEEIQVVSNIINIDIPMPYEVSLERAENAIYQICEEIKDSDNVDDCQYVSVNELASSSINYLIKVYCNPIHKLQVRRDALRTILAVMAKNNISVPYTQIDIHEK